MVTRQNASGGWWWIDSKEEFFECEWGWKFVRFDKVEELVLTQARQPEEDRGKEEKQDGEPGESI